MTSIYALASNITFSSKHSLPLPKAFGKPLINTIQIASNSKMPPHVPENSMEVDDDTPRNHYSHNISNPYRRGPPEEMPSVLLFSGLPLDVREADLAVSVAWDCVLEELARGGWVRLGFVLCYLCCGGEASRLLQPLGARIRAYNESTVELRALLELAFDTGRGNGFMMVYSRTLLTAGTSRC